MNDKHIKEFESKLQTAFKPECAISAWSIDRGHFIGFEIRRGHNRYWADNFLASGLSTAHDVEVKVRAIANLAADLEVAWSFFIHAPALKPRGRAKPSLREQLFC